MDPSAFHGLVGQLEELGRRDAAALRRRVRAWTMLGDAFLATAVLLPIAAMLAVIWGLHMMDDEGGPLILGAAFVFVLVLLGIAFANWWFRQPPLRSGESISPAQAPALWARVNAIQSTLGSPRVDSVVVVADHNAALFRETRIGPYLSGRAHLYLGLPLLYALPKTHLDAVIAHEIAHTFGVHARPGRNLERAWRIWGALEATNLHPVTRIPGIYSFVRWYVPRLQAHEAALSRLSEFEADQASARATNTRTAKCALAAIAVNRHRFDAFLTQMWAKVEHGADAPAQSWSHLVPFFSQPIAENDCAEWLARELRRDHLVEASHPSLRARLEALERSASSDASGVMQLDDLVARPGDSAADRYLGLVAPEILHKWDREWREAVQADWTARHARARSERERVNELIARDTNSEALSKEEIWDVAARIAALDGDEAALPWLRRAVAASPDNAAAQFVLGRALLAQRDPTGIPHLERAMELQVDAVPLAAALLRAFHADAGDSDASRAADARAAPHFQRLAQARDERRSVDKKDKLRSFELTDGMRDRLVAAARLNRVKRLWVVRKETVHNPDRPLIVVLIQAKPLHFTATDREAMRRMTEDVYTTVHGDEGDFLVMQWIAHGWLRKKIRRVGGFLVDRKKGTVAPSPFRWHERHRRALVAGTAVATVIALVTYLYTLPRDFYDQHGILGPVGWRTWGAKLQAMRYETDVDVRLAIDSLAPGTSIDAYTDTARAGVGLGRSYGGRGLYAVIDAARGKLRLHATPEMATITPRRFLQRVVAAYEHGAPAGDSIEMALEGVMALVHHRLREASLRPPIAPRDGLSQDSVPLVGGNGARTYVRVGGLLETQLVGDTALERLLGPGTTPQEVVERHGEWLRLAVFVPRAQFLTRGSRLHFEKLARMTPARWDHWRHLYAGRLMQLVTRGNLAVAFSSTDPLVPPLFIRKTTAGWQLDALAGFSHVTPLEFEAFSWALTRPAGTEFDVAFADQFIRIRSFWRFRGGANGVIVGCGCLQ